MSKAIQVSLDKGTISFSEDRSEVRCISTFAVGRPGHETPRFGARPLSGERQQLHVSSKYPPPHGGARMPFAVFFDAANGDAFHEGDVKTPSHGCIHLGPEDAHWLFNWVAKEPVEVSIEGEYPKSPLFPHA